MTRAAALYSSCEICDDADANAAQLQALVDLLQAESVADGWPGVKVVEFSNDGRFACVGIEPGPSPLTLDYLRRLKEAGKETETKPAPPVLVAEDGRLL